MILLLWAFIALVAFFSLLFVSCLNDHGLSRDDNMGRLFARVIVSFSHPEALLNLHGCFLLLCVGAVTKATSRSNCLRFFLLCCWSVCRKILCMTLLAFAINLCFI